jgi:hypothetical protein
LSDTFQSVKGTNALLQEYGTLLVTAIVKGAIDALHAKA